MKAKLFNWLVNVLAIAMIVLLTVLTFSCNNSEPMEQEITDRNQIESICQLNY